MYKHIIGNKWLLAFTGLIVGLLIMMGVRFTTYKAEEAVHYHANFALYINGQREQFKDDFYYTESAESCSEQEQMTPRERAHMHGNVNDVVHVEDHAVTWGNFFQNLGWTIDSTAIITPSKVIPADATNKVSFILNGEKVDGVANTVIKDQDKLLIDYGSTPADILQAEYNAIPSTAIKYDNTQDPASCSGHRETTMRDRFMHMF